MNKIMNKIMNKNISCTTVLTICLLAVLLVLPMHAGSFKLPNYDKFKLKNGLTVYLMEQHEVPLIYVSAIFPAGAIKDGKQSGLASLTAEGLLLGTKSYTKSQIEEQLDFIGASYNTYAGLESAEISMSFAEGDREKVFPILKELIQAPVFDKKEFEKKKKRLLLQLDRAKEQPNRVIGSYYAKFLFGGHVYGNPTGGSKKSVTAITAEQLKKFYKANYKPAESAIAIVGDFKTAIMKKQVQKLLGGWKAGGASAPVEMGTAVKTSKSRILLVNKEDALETQFYIGGLGPQRSTPDYVAIQVINTILGGRFTSWLNDELRVNAGLTYGAGSTFRFYKSAGSFYIRSFTKTATTVKAIDLALEVLGRLHKKGLDQKTLDSAKNYIKGQFPPRYETSGRLAGLLTQMFFYGFDKSFIDNFQQNVDSLTLAKAKEIIKKYFPGNNLQFVLIGKASEIKDKVKKYGELIQKEIKDDGF